MQNFKQVVNKDIHLFDDVKRSLIEGAKIVHDAVGATMGPGGQLCIFDGNTTVAPKITKDGVTVASEINIADKHINKGISMVIQACRSQVKKTGDGTTLTAIMAYRLLENGYRLIQAKMNPRELIESMQNYSNNQVIPYLESITRECKTKEILTHIATVSANGDKELGKLIGEAVFNTGEFGFIASHIHKKLEHEISYFDGISLNTGIRYPEFATIKEKMVLDLDISDEAFVCVTDIDMQFTDDIFPIINLVKKINEQNSTTRPLIIFANDIRGGAFSTLVKTINRKALPMHVAWIRPIDHAGPIEREYKAKDIAALTGARFLSEKNGDRLLGIKESDLGVVKAIMSGPLRTLITGLNNAECENRKTHLKAMIANFDSDCLEKRTAIESYAQLNGGMASLAVGGQNESAQSEAYDRVDDAVKACRCAYQSGIAPGGGVAFLDYVRLHEKPKELGAGILYDALSYPIEKILDNYAHPKKHIIIENIKQSGGGYTIQAGYTKDTNMYEHQIIDPTGVLIEAIRNAVSVTSQMLQAAISISDV